MKERVVRCCYIMWIVVRSNTYETYIFSPSFKDSLVGRLVRRKVYTKVGYIQLS